MGSHVSVARSAGEEAIMFRSKCKSSKRGNKLYMDEE